MLTKTKQNPILAEDMDYILSRLSPTEKDRIKDSTILITGSGVFSGYCFMHFFATCVGEELLDEVDHTVILTGWSEFKEKKNLVQQKNVFDFRYIY